MSHTTYEILPATRTWDAPTETLANQLADGCIARAKAHSYPDDGRAELAAVGLLMRLGPAVFACAEVRANYSVEWRAGQRSELNSALAVHWARLAHTVRHLNTMPVSDRAAVQLACSLADGRVLVCLGGLLAVMTADAREHFLEAMRYAGSDR